MDRSGGRMYRSCGYYTVYVFYSTIISKVTLSVTVESRAFIAMFFYLVLSIPITMKIVSQDDSFKST